MDDVTRALYDGSRMGILLELCIDCGARYCFFDEALTRAGGSLSRESSGLADPNICPFLQEVVFRTTLTDEQLFRRKLMSDLRYEQGLKLGRNPSREEVDVLWKDSYEERFLKAYENGVRNLERLRVDVLGKNS